MNQESDTLLADLCVDPELSSQQDTVTKDPIGDTKTSDQG